MILYCYVCIYDVCVFTTAVRPGNIQSGGAVVEVHDAASLTDTLAVLFISKEMYRACSEATEQVVKIFEEEKQ